MNKLEKTVVGIVFLIALGALIMGILALQEDRVLGNVFRESNAYSSAVTHSTSSITNDLATSLIPRATSSRTIAKVCHVSGGVVWIMQQATSTGVLVNRGTPIFSTTTSGNPTLEACATYDINDPYTGQVWGVSNATSVVSISYLQQ